MDYKIECIVKKITGNSEDCRNVLIIPTEKFKVLWKNPIESGSAIEYALFVEHQFFSPIASGKDTYEAKLVMMKAPTVELKAQFGATGFDYANLAAAQAAKSRVRLLVDSKLKNVESVELI